MAKIQNLSEIQPTLGFTEFDILEKYRKSFNESELGIRHPRNKYADVADAYLSYCKKRKRKVSRTRMIRLLEKLLIQMDEIHRKYGTALRYTQDYQKRLSVIRKVLRSELSREKLRNSKAT